LRYMPIFRLGGFLVMDMSRKLTVLLISVEGLSWMLL
jgi:hypothetical protein